MLRYLSNFFLYVLKDVFGYLPGMDDFIADAGENQVYKAVTFLAVLPVVTAVVQFDDGFDMHTLVADNKINVLGLDLIEQGLVFLLSPNRLDNIQQADLRTDHIAFGIGNRFQQLVVVEFILGQQISGSVTLDEVAIIFDGC